MSWQHSKNGDKVQFGRQLTPKEQALKDYKAHVEQEPNPNSTVALKARIERLEQVVFTHLSTSN